LNMEFSEESKYPVKNTIRVVKWMSQVFIPNIGRRRDPAFKLQRLAKASVLFTSPVIPYMNVARRLGVLGDIVNGAYDPDELAI